ncbi:ribosome 60S biogenesis N-terminal-domain-containing protein, partial [Choanephora cucurbitarum]
MNSNITQLEEYYKTPKEVAEALKVKDLQALIRGLSRLRSQLTFAVRIRVDPTEKHTRPLVEYCQSCPDSHDLNSLWDYQASSNLQDLECMLPDIVGLFIRLCATPVIRSYGIQLIQTILQRQMKYIYRGISSMRIPHCQSTFRLLTSIVSFNESTARDFFTTFNFQAEGFLRASRYRQNKKTKKPQSYIYDLRTNYVHFVLAFFQHADSDIKRQVLGIKGLVSGVFVNMEEDAYPLIEQILSVMYEKLILDTNVPRSAKAFFFSSYILEKLAKLYSRYDEEETGPEETGIPADLVHHFLISICSVPDVGVCFKDTAWYPAQVSPNEEAPATKQTRITNRVLAKFITTLKPSDDMRQQELLLKILAACPELVQEYWSNSTLMFEPRISSKWLANMTVLQKTVQLAVPSLLYGSSRMYPADPPAAETILDNILPNVFGRSPSSKGLQHASPLVRYTTMIVLSASFQKYGKVAHALKQVIMTLESSELDQKRHFNEKKEQQKPSDNWKKCLENVREGLRRRVPEIQTLVALYKQTTNKTVPEGMDGEEFVAQNQLMQDTAFRLIRYYQEFVPEALMESNVDPGNFIPSDILSIKPGTLIHLLKLFISMPDFDWTSRSSGSSTSHITTLLTLYLQTPFKPIRDLTAKLINQTLSESFMFRHDPDEVELWLNALPQNHHSLDNQPMSTTQQAILQFLDNCISRFSKAQYKYTDQLVSLVNKINTEKLSSNQNELLSTLMVADVGSASNYQHPFSPLLLTLCENINFIKTDRTPAIFYVTNLITSLLTKQNVSYYLESICSRLDQELDNEDRASVRQAHQWTKNEMILQAKKCLGKATDAMLVDQTSTSSKEQQQLEKLLQKGAENNVVDCRRQFVDLLNQLAVDELDLCLETVATFCHQELQWTSYEPLVDYLCIRHPLAGNVFSYKDVLQMELLPSSEHKHTSSLLKKLPFTHLFFNVATNKSYHHSLAMETLKHALNTMKSRGLMNVATLLFQHLNMTLLDTAADMDAVTFCFTLLRHITDLVKQMQDVKMRTELYVYIFNHPSLKYIRSQLIDCIEQLQHASASPSSTHIQLLKLATSFIDLLGEGPNAHVLLKHVVQIDFSNLAALEDNTVHSIIKKMLIVLVETIYKSATAEDYKIPNKAFEIMAQLWKHDVNENFNLQVLSLLELSLSKSQEKDEVEKHAVHVLLEVCCEPIMRHMLAGKKCNISNDLLYSACVSSSVDVATIVIEHLSNSLLLTPQLVDVLVIGYRLLGEKEEEDNQAEFVKRVTEHLLKLLTSAADMNSLSTEPPEE